MDHHDDGTPRPATGRLRWRLVVPAWWWWVLGAAAMVFVPPFIHAMSSVVGTPEPGMPWTLRLNDPNGVRASTVDVRRTWTFRGGLRLEGTMSHLDIRMLVRGPIPDHDVVPVDDRADQSRERLEAVATERWATEGFLADALARYWMDPALVLLPQPPTPVRPRPRGAPAPFPPVPTTPVPASSFIVSASGWPQPAFAGIAWHEDGTVGRTEGLLIFGTDRMEIPLRPLPRGLAVNALVGAVLGAAVGIAARIGRAAVRHARGRCVVCNHRLWATVVPGETEAARSRWGRVRRSFGVVAHVIPRRLPRVRVVVLGAVVFVLGGSAVDLFYGGRWSSLEATETVLARQWVDGHIVWMSLEPAGRRATGWRATGTIWRAPSVRSAADEADEAGGSDDGIGMQLVTGSEQSTVVRMVHDRLGLGQAALRWYDGVQQSDDDRPWYRFDARSTGWPWPAWFGLDAVSRKGVVWSDGLIVIPGVGAALPVRPQWRGLVPNLAVGVVAAFTLGLVSGVMRRITTPAGRRCSECGAADPAADPDAAKTDGGGRRGRGRSRVVRIASAAVVLAALAWASWTLWTTPPPTEARGTPNSAPVIERPAATPAIAAKGVP